MDISCGSRQCFGGKTSWSLFGVWEGCKNDCDLAAQYYHMTVRRGPVEAQYHFAFCPEHGFGVGISLFEACVASTFSITNSSAKVFHG
jgi:hypothetical protein